MSDLFKKGKNKCIGSRLILPTSFSDALTYAQQIMWLYLHKQNKLVAGDNITLSPNSDGTVTISATGEEPTTYRIDKVEPETGYSAAYALIDVNSGEQCGETIQIPKAGGSGNNGLVVLCDKEIIAENSYNDWTLATSVFQEENWNYEIGDRRNIYTARCFDLGYTENVVDSVLIEQHLYVDIYVYGYKDIQDTRYSLNILRLWTQEHPPVHILNGEGDEEFAGFSSLKFYTYLYMKCLTMGVDRTIILPVTVDISSALDGKVQISVDYTMFGQYLTIPAGDYELSLVI